MDMFDAMVYRRFNPQGHRRQVLYMRLMKVAVALVAIGVCGLILR